MKIISFKNDDKIHGNVTPHFFNFSIKKLQLYSLFVTSLDILLCPYLILLYYD